MVIDSTPQVLLKNYDPQSISLGTGSPEYQIANSTQRINYLTNHLIANKKDFSSKFGLTKLVSHRKKLLKYLKDENEERYKQIIKHLGLRK